MLTLLIILAAALVLAIIALYLSLADGRTELVRVHTAHTRQLGEMRAARDAEVDAMRHQHERVLGQYDTERRWMIQQLSPGPPMQAASVEPWPETRQDLTEEQESRAVHLRVLERYTEDEIPEPGGQA